jgi:putative DNA primase/helicase
MTFSAFPSLKEIARKLGGEVCGKLVLAPGPGHSPIDRSLQVSLSPTAPDGFLVHSFASDNDLACKDYVRSKLGLPEWKPNGALIGEPIHDGQLMQAMRDITPAGFRPTGLWRYRDVEGKACIFATARYDDAEGKKTYRPFIAFGGKVVSKFPSPRPLYGLDRLASRPHDPVIVVEGEKTADAASELFGDEFVVTTSIGGSKAVNKTDWRPLVGRDVVAWPDHDPAGDEYVAAIRKHLPRLKIVKVPETWPPKWDLADTAPSDMTNVGLRQMIDEAGAQIDLEEAIAAIEAKPLPRTTSLMGNGKAPMSQRAKQQKAEAKALADKYCNPDGTPLTEKQLKEQVAGMDALDYDRQRLDIAAGVGVRVPTLDRIRAEARTDRAAASILADAPALWPEPVDGDDLLDQIAAIAGRYLFMPEGGLEAFALWAVYTHCFDAFDTSVMLAFLSPTPEAGKTRCLGILRALTPKPLLASNVTGPATFRVIELAKPTLLIDELDTILHDEDGSALRGVLNSGHDREGAYVLRCTGDSLEPHAFSTWCPKALAGIGKLTATLASRSIVIAMKRKLQSDVSEKWRPSKSAPLFEPLKQQAARWAKDNEAALAQAEPEIPSALYGREEDKWRPLLAVADAAGGHWPERAREVAVFLGGRRDDLTIGVLLLGAIREILVSLGENTERIKSEDLAAALAEREGEPWPEFRNNKPITQNQIAKLLGPFGVKPRNIKLSVGKVAKGYLGTDFADAFTRYLPKAGI